MFATEVGHLHDHDYEEHANRYRICQWAFALVALGVLLRAVDVALHLAFFFHPRVFLAIPGQLFEHPVYQCAVKGTLCVALLLGPYLLWGRWSEPAWKRRNGLLLTIALVDIILWVLDNEDILGMRLIGDHHKWLRLHVARAISWLQIYLGTLVVADFLAHLDKPREARGAHTILGFLAAGVCLWILYMIRQTAWMAGWPLAQVPLDPLALIVLIAYLLPLTIASIQLLALCLLCYRESAVLSRDLRAEAADPGQAMNALKSRSELDDPWA